MKTYKYAAIMLLIFALLLTACGQSNTGSGGSGTQPQAESGQQTQAGESAQTGGQSSTGPSNGPSKETSTEPSKEPTTVRLGLVCGAMPPFLALVGINDGSFDNAGLKVEKVCFNSGADAVQALVGGSIDINLGSYEHVLRQRKNGLDVKAYAALYNGLSYVLVTKSDAPYQKVSDLKNTTIGVTKAGSLSDTGLRMILEKENLNPDRDVQIVSGGSGATMLAALESNKVVAGMVAEPTVSQMVASGDYRILFDPPYEYVGLVAMAKTDWVNNNREAAKAFLQVLSDVRDRTEKDPASAVNSLVSEFEQISPDILEKALVSELKRVPADLKVSKEGADAVVQSQIELGAISKEVPFEETIDMSLLPQ